MASKYPTTGYWFSGDKLRDGRPLPKAGVWLRHKGPLVPCASGLHWSACPFDALQFAPGNLLHRVEVSGKTIPHGSPIDKYCSRRRKIIATIDAGYVMRRFAADQALRVSHLWTMPANVREYLETLDDSELSAAWSAARSAAWSAARSAASAAARAAASDAAWSAASAAARAAASVAAWSAASAAAWDAARAAARADARAAAWSDARIEFVRRVEEAFDGQS